MLEVNISYGGVEQNTRFLSFQAKTRRLFFPSPLQNQNPKKPIFISLTIISLTKFRAFEFFQSLRSSLHRQQQATPLVTGVAVATAALASKYAIRAWQVFKARPPTARMSKFYEGGFQPSMTRREAARILGLRESATMDKVKEAYRRVMMANHPDAGGSHYLSSKVNEAKDMMLGKTKGSGSAF